MLTYLFETQLTLVMVRGQSIGVVTRHFYYINIIKGRKLKIYKYKWTKITRPFCKIDRGTRHERRKAARGIRI